MKNLMLIQKMKQYGEVTVIDFPVKFVYNPDPKNKFQKKRDDSLKDKIKSWYSIFMHKLLIYYKQYVSDGLEEPESVMQFTEEYKKECDHFTAFFDECIEVLDEPLDSVIPESTLNTFDRLIRNWLMHSNIDRSQTPSKNNYKQ